VRSALTTALDRVVSFVPVLLLFLVVLVVGLLVARALGEVVDRVLTRVGFDRVVERGALGRVLDGTRTTPSDVVAKIVWYALALFVLQLAFGVFGANPISDLLGRLIAYLPQVVIAIVVLVVAAAIARAVRDLVTSTLSGLPYGRGLGTGAFVVVLFLGAVAALGQLGVATAVTTPVLVAVLAVVAGILVVGVGGGLVRPMQSRWEGWLDSAARESGVISAKVAEAAVVRERERLELVATREREARAAAVTRAREAREAAEAQAARRAEQRRLADERRQEAARVREEADAARAAAEADRAARDRDRQQVYDRQHEDGQHEDGQQGRPGERWSDPEWGEPGVAEAREPHASGPAGAHSLADHRTADHRTADRREADHREADHREADRREADRAASYAQEGSTAGYATPGYSTARYPGADDPTWIDLEPPRRDAGDQVTRRRRPVEQDTTDPDARYRDPEDTRHGGDGGH